MIRGREDTCGQRKGAHRRSEEGRTKVVRGREDSGGQRKVGHKHFLNSNCSFALGHRTQLIA